MGEGLQNHSMTRDVLPGVGNGLPAHWRDQLDGELLLQRVDVALICREDQQIPHVSKDLHTRVDSGAAAFK